VSDSRETEQMYHFISLPQPTMHNPHTQHDEKASNPHITDDPIAAGFTLVGMGLHGLARVWPDIRSLGVRAYTYSRGPKNPICPAPLIFYLIQCHPFRAIPSAESPSVAIHPVLSPLVPKYSTTLPVSWEACGVGMSLRQVLTPTKSG